MLLSALHQAANLSVVTGKGDVSLNQLINRNSFGGWVVQAQRARTRLVQEVVDLMDAAGIDAFIGNTSEELAMANLVSMPTVVGNLATHTTCQLNRSQMKADLCNVRQQWRVYSSGESKEICHVHGAGGAHWPCATEECPKQRQEAGQVTGHLWQTPDRCQCEHSQFNLACRLQITYTVEAYTWTDHLAGTHPAD